MIRLRTIMIVLLVPCFFFVQGGVVAVYSSGVTIFVNSGAISSVTPGNQPPASTPGNQAPASTPGNTGTSTTTSTTSSTTPGTQNISSFVTSPSSNSSISTSQQLQQQPNTTDNLLQTLEQTETSKLIGMPNFNPLSEDESLLPMAESYTVTVCISYNNIAVSECQHIKTPLQASQMLAEMMLNKYLKGIEIRPFRIVLPSAAPLTEQTQLLRKIETEAIAIIEAKMLEELKKSKIFLSESEEGRQKRLNIIIEDAKRALQEADSGANWSHNIKNDRTSHDFQSAKAFKQFINNMSVAELKSQ